MHARKNNGKRRWKHWLAIALVIGILLVPTSNEVARRVGASFLGGAINGKGEIGKVRLGFRRLRVERVVAWTAGCQEPTLSVSAVTADLSIRDGLHSGVWIKRIVVERPELQLHFDEAGELITRLPQSESQETTEPLSTLPFRQVTIVNAKIAVHQFGRESFVADGIAVNAIADGAKLSIETNVADVFSSRVHAQSNVDVATLRAESSVLLDGIKVTSQRLVTMPLVPASVNSRPWSASTSVEITQSGTLDDLESLRVNVRANDVRAAMTNGPELLAVDVTATLDKGSIVARAKGKVLDGPFEALVQSTVTDEPVASIALHCNGLTTDAFPDGVLPPDVRSSLDSNLKLDASYSNGLLAMRGNSESTISDTNTFGIAFAPTTIAVSVDGNIDMRGGADSSGAVSAIVVSEGVSLGQLTANPPPKLPAFVQPHGMVRAVAKIDLPLASITDPATYFVNGFIDAKGVIVNGILVEHGRGRVVLDKAQTFVDFRDILLVDQINGEKSSVSAVASVGIDSDSELQAQFRINRIAAGTIGRLASVTDRTIAGELQAHATARCKMSQIGSPKAWLGAATLQARSITVDGEQVAHCEARCRLSDGRLSVEQIQGTICAGTLAGEGSLQLSDLQEFQGHVSIQDVDIGRISLLSQQSQTPGITGELDVVASAAGRIASNEWQARGTIVGSELNIGSRAFGDTRLDFNADPSEVVVSTPPNGFLGGELNATVSLGSNPSVTARVADMSLPAIAQIAGVRERIDGDLSIEVVANELSDLLSLNADIVATSSAVALRNGTLKQLRTDVTIRDGNVAAKLNARGFGGEVELQANAKISDLTTLDEAALQQLSAIPVNAIASVTDIDLQELWPVVGQQQQLRPLRGTFSASFERGDAERQMGTIAMGTARVRDVRWDNVLWSNQIAAELVVGDKLVELREVSGPFAGGRINGRGRVALDRSNNGSFELSASRISLKKALVPIDRRGETASGLLSMRVQGRLGQRPSGRALVSMDRGTVGPIALARLRVPVDWTFDPAAKSVQWRTSNAGVELGGGRVVTNASGRWNGKLDMRMTTSARRVDTGRILKGNSTAGGGYLDGTFRMAAKRATDANDFTGTFDATLSNASSLELPVVSDLTKFLTTLPTTTSFDESRIQGRLGNGIVHLNRVTLAAANVQILAEGTATLQGRLNLQVMARTNQTGPADKLLELADSPLLMAAPTPIALVAKANNALKDRVVHLRVGGTSARPVIRLEPGRQLGQEAIKFFMNQALAFRGKSDDLSFR